MNARVRAARLRILLAAAAAAVILVGCGRHSSGSDLRVGYILPLSGPFTPYAATLREGARLAVAQANRDGGVLVAGRRHKVVIVEKDGSNSAESALAAAQELIRRDGVSAIVGPVLSGQAIPVAHLVDRSGIPMIVQIATNPDVTRNTRSVFRVCFTDDFQGQAMARFARERLAARRIALLYDAAGDYNSGISAIFVREVAALGGLIVAEESYVTGERDFRPKLRKIRAARPDLLFLPNYANEIVAQVTQARELGITAAILGSDGMGFSDPDYLAAIEGAWYAVHFSAENADPGARQFIHDFTERNGHEPDQLAALSFDAFGLLLQAARAGRSVEPGDIAEALRAVDVFEGVTGTMIFRGSPDPRKPVVIVRVRGGKPRFEARIDP